MDMKPTAELDFLCVSRRERRGQFRGSWAEGRGDPTPSQAG